MTYVFSTDFFLGLGDNAGDQSESDGSESDSSATDVPGLPSGAQSVTGTVNTAIVTEAATAGKSAVSENKRFKMYPSRETPTEVSELHERKNDNDTTWRRSVVARMAQFTEAQPINQNLSHLEWY